MSNESKRSNLPIIEGGNFELVQCRRTVEQLEREKEELGRNYGRLVRAYERLEGLVGLHDPNELPEPPKPIKPPRRWVWFLIGFVCNGIILTPALMMQKPPMDAQKAAEVIATINKKINEAEQGFCDSLIKATNNGALKRSDAVEIAQGTRCDLTKFESLRK